MSPNDLLDRQLARVSGVELTAIRHRQISEEDRYRLDAAAMFMESFADRLCFVATPYHLGNVADAANEFEANMIVLDYIQRIPPRGSYGDRRGNIDAAMNDLRVLAGNGCAVVVVAAVARTKDSRGRSSYAADGLGLASFRESSELEFGADDAFILLPDKKNHDLFELRHLKARHAQPRNLFLHFDRPLQRFDVADEGATASDRTQEGPTTSNERLSSPPDYRDYWSQSA